VICSICQTGKNFLIVQSVQLTWQGPYDDVAGDVLVILAGAELAVTWNIHG
jgi:hypothetical protein